MWYSTKAILQIYLKTKVIKIKLTLRYFQGSILFHLGQQLIPNLEWALHPGWAVLTLRNKASVI